MEHSQKLNEAAEALLKEYGYNVDIVLDRVGNDRDFDPDYVLCRLAKDGQLMFRAEFRTELGNSRQSGSMPFQQRKEAPFQQIRP